MSAVKLNLTDNVADEEVFTPAQRGKHLLVIGSNAGAAFDSGTVVLKQHGITLKDTAGNNVSATAASRFVVDGLTDDVPVTATATGVAGAAADVDVSAYKLPDN